MARPSILREAASNGVLRCSRASDGCAKPDWSPCVSIAKSYVLLACFASLLGACSSTPVTAPPSVATVNTPARSTPSTTAGQGSAPISAAAATTTQAPAGSVTGKSLPTYLDPTSELSTARSVFFDYDESLVKSEFSDLVQRHGTYLASNPNIAVRIEGNTDERGGAEYNLALGQRRAEAVKQALKIAGVRDTQMEAISWGKERPRAVGHSEADWRQNRRADIQYPAK
jgi:peptidoglycan-associated lipoprotein